MRSMVAASSSRVSLSLSLASPILMPAMARAKAGCPQLGPWTYSQSSTNSPGTLENSSMLCVTTVTLLERAIPAIWRS